MIFDLQKASILKRISAFILDAILLCIIAAGFAFLLSVVVRYDAHYQNMENSIAAFEKKTGLPIDITEEEYNSLTDDVKQQYNSSEALSAYQEATYNYRLIVNLTLLVTSLGIFTGFLALEFIVPLILKNGQTVGKKVFGIGVMRTDSVRVSPTILFIRTFLGKYTIETMVPVLIIIMIFFNSIGVVGIIVLGAVLLLQVVFIIATKTNSLIHDILAKTVAVDLASQLIFDTEDEKTEYIKKIHADETERKEY